MTAPSATVVIPARYNGPPTSGNGGYACGVAAGALNDGPAEVVLRRPPPLDVPLVVVETERGIELQDEGQVVAAAVVWDGRVDVPPRPTDAVVDLAVAGFDVDAYASGHAFGRCFTCGPSRPDHDGLCIYPAGISGTEMVVWRWTPAPSTGADDGLVAAAVVWAALDCPSVLCWIDAPDGSTTSGPAVLGRFAVRIDRRPAVGEPLVVAGWQTGADGRKLFGSAAVWDADGEVLAVSAATWILLDEAQAAAFGAQA